MALINNPGSGGNTNFTDGSIPYSSGGILTENNTNFKWDNATTTLFVNGVSFTPGKYSASTGASFVGFTQSGTGATSGNVQTELRRVVAPEQYGAVRDGVTDDLAAFQRADTYLVTRGGGRIQLQPGTYVLSSRYQPSSGIELVGAGVGSTIIKNTAVGSPSNIAIDIRGALGTAYAINTPTEGANTVTTTTAGNAGNFAANDKIALAGSLVGNDYIPFLITTVSAVNAGTGVITLAEKLRQADYTQVLKVTTQINNVAVRDLSITQASDTGLIVKYARNVLIDNVYINVSNNSAQFVGSREIEARQLICDGKKLLIHSCADSTFTGPVVRGADFTLEGGCTDVDVLGAKVYDPTTGGITINTGSRRCRLLGGAVVNTPAAGGAVLIDGSGYSNVGENSVIGMTLSGGGAGANGVTVGTSNRNVIVGNTIRGFTTGVRIGAGSCLDNVAHSNAITGATNNYVINAGSSVIDPMGPTTIETFTDQATTPSVRNGKSFLTANTLATSITNFTDGTPGKLITIQFGDTNTTLAVGAGNLRLDGGVNYVSTVRATIQLFNDGTRWQQVGKVSVNN